MCIYIYNKNTALVIKNVTFIVWIPVFLNSPFRSPLNQEGVLRRCAAAQAARGGDFSHCASVFSPSSQGVLCAVCCATVPSCLVFLGQCSGFSFLLPHCQLGLKVALSPLFIDCQLENQLTKLAGGWLKVGLDGLWRMGELSFLRG